MMDLLLPARQPFSLAAVIHSHGWIRLAPFREVDHGGLSHVSQLAGGRVVETIVREAGDGVRLIVPQPLSASEQEEVAARTRWMLGLEQDFSSFYALAREAPALAHVAERAQGRFLRSPTLFEDVVKTILTTNTAWHGTVRMAASLVNVFGDPLPDDPDRRAFPLPQRLAESDEQTLRVEAGLGYRAPYILELARAVADGKLDLEAYKTTTLAGEDLRRELLAIKGVGDYAAAHLCMLLGHYGSVPVDSWARKMVSQEWFEGRPVGRAEVEAAFAPWGEWQALAYALWDWQAGDGA